MGGSAVVVQGESAWGVAAYSRSRAFRADLLSQFLVDTITVSEFFLTFLSHNLAIIFSGKAYSWSVTLGPNSHCNQTLFHHGDHFVLVWGRESASPVTMIFGACVGATVIEKGRLLTQYGVVDVQFDMASVLFVRTAGTPCSGNLPPPRRKARGGLWSF